MYEILHGIKLNLTLIPLSYTPLTIETRGANLKVEGRYKWKMGWLRGNGREVGKGSVVARTWMRKAIVG